MFLIYSRKFEYVEKHIQFRRLKWYTILAVLYYSRTDVCQRVATGQTLELLSDGPLSLCLSSSYGKS